MKITVEKTVNGYLVLSARVNGYLVRRKYLYYTRSEARAEFLADVQAERAKIIEEIAP
jgi:hypothetical protein